MTKKLTAEERKKAEKREKLAQELLKIDYNFNYESQQSDKPIQSVKTPSQKLITYISIIENSVFWSSRENYLELLQSFLSKKIDAKTFTFEFCDLRGQDMDNASELCEKIENDIVPIPDFYYTHKAACFISIIDELFFDIDRYEPNIENSDNIDDYDLNNVTYSENELRWVIQEKFVPRLQQSCDLNFK